MIYLVSGYALLGLVCLGAFSWCAGKAMLCALAEHMGAPPRPRLSGPRRYQAAASERIGFSSRVR